ncbi:hypothetical protein NM688_g7979 [Phlebia brevispora]|uniref:Uncharacterized protein n=1 Tax=Phlebia brevispora TaxID=194682 RepID=A0ACC1RYZ7_9APHY|nr:hypothetical protein NM688_g7979 [Phlebia brevispora]
MMAVRRWIHIPGASSSNVRSSVHDLLVHSDPPTKAQFLAATMSSNSSWTPDEPYDTLFLERTFMAGDVICGVGFGIQLVMYSYCAAYLWKQRRVRRHSLFILSYITLIFIVETIFVAVQARTVQICYIDNRNYPGGPWQYFLATQNLPVNVMFYATLFIITFLCDCLVLWRCWIIWTASGRVLAYVVAVIPGLMVLASFAMGVLWTLQSSQPGLSFYSALPLAYGTSYYAISLSINILLTVLIMIRLYQYRRAVLSSLPAEHAKHYLSLATVLIESATLYSVFALLFLVTYAIDNPINEVCLGIAQATQQISTYLIIYRLADGRAWKSDTLGNALTTVQFGLRTLGKTTMETETETVGGPEPYPEASGSRVFVSEKEKAQSPSVADDMV